MNFSFLEAAVNAKYDTTMEEVEKTFKWKIKSINDMDRRKKKLIP